MAEPNRQKIAADWAARGSSCDLRTDPPGHRWENFTHATDGWVHHPKLGEELLISAAAVHSARTARWRGVRAKASVGDENLGFGDSSWMSDRLVELHRRELHSAPLDDPGRHIDVLAFRSVKS